MATKASLKSLQKTVAAAGTAEPLAASDLYVRKAKLKALSGNTDLVYIGDSTASATTGYALKADEEIDLHDLYHKDNFVLNLAEIYVDSVVNAEGVSLIYLV